MSNEKYFWAGAAFCFFHRFYSEGAHSSPHPHPSRPSPSPSWGSIDTLAVVVVVVVALVQEWRGGRVCMCARVGYLIGDIGHNGQTPFLLSPCPVTGDKVQPTRAGLSQANTSHGAQCGSNLHFTGPAVGTWND